MHGKINHLGIAVNDLDAALKTFHEILGLKLRERRAIPERGLEIAFLESGESLIELLAPLSEDSQVSKFLEKRGEGIHHLCLEVDDIEAEIARLAESGVKVLGAKPEIGAEGHPVAFLHPRSTNGVLLELIQPT